ncbi:phage transcriptional regulator AlpA [Salinisphaera sp. T5B8]|uniref:DNA-binding protein n=1 Tax=Salinisphaera sp. T5B8 TaxID=1304154 RepID=UPI00333E40D0
MGYIFTLKYRLHDHDGDEEALIDRLFEAGCDDALPGIGQSGRLALEFTREANSATDALESAIADVRKAVDNAELVEVLPDYAGLTDIAEHVGMSRQNLRKITTKNGSTFPPAVHEGNPSLWHLSDALSWLAEHGYAVDAATLETSAAARELNTAVQARRLSDDRSRELEALMA